MVLIRERAAALGIPYTKRFGWKVGREAQKAWQKQYKRRPPMALHVKTSGRGSHMIADYPQHWRYQLDLILKRCDPKWPLRQRKARKVR